MASLSSSEVFCSIDVMFDLDDALDTTTYFPINDEATHYQSKSDPKKPLFASMLPVVAAGSEGAAGGCSVCIESFGPIGNTHEEGRQIHCGHVFHAACIDKWVSMYDSCPLCRCKVDPACTYV